VDVFDARSTFEKTLMAKKSPNLRRRGVLLNSLRAAIAATVFAILYPVVCFLRPRAATVSGAQEVTAPFRTGELTTSGGRTFDFGGKPCLVVLTSEGAKRVAARQPLRSDDVRAFNAICTHVDCTVKYRREQSDIFCSCHDGVYDLNGRNVSGPPPRPLETYKVALRGDPGEEEIIVSRES
jgi:Rieske Fe-S protein